MAASNFERMLQLAEEVFDVKNDPHQLDVDEKVIEQLQKLHPACVSEEDDENGPIAWLLLIPTTNELMQQFLAHTIGEKELLAKTPINGKYEAIYLCSALVLEEYRRNGITQKLAMEAINKIKKDHPINSLFVWPFSEEGKRSAKKIAHATQLKLLEINYTK